MATKIARISFLFAMTFLMNSFAASAKSRGEQWYKLCQACHGVNGEGNADLQAPAIAGLPTWYVERQLQNFSDGSRGAHPSDFPGMRMRPMARTIKSKEDMKAVADFVAKMPSVKAADTIKGSLVNGEQKYQVCAACHQADGSGNKDLNAPSFKGVNDWYLLTQLKNFKAGIRGNPSKDPIGAAMGPMASQLDDQDMLDVVAYINVLKRKLSSD